MPIYEYECDACGHRFEKKVSFGAEPPPCPSCAAASVHKRISASGFILKGGGWYKDHYGLKSGDAGKSEAKADAKPAESKPAESKPAPSKPAASGSSE